MQSPDSERDITTTPLWTVLLSFAGLAGVVSALIVIFRLFTSPPPVPPQPVPVPSARPAPQVVEELSPDEVRALFSRTAWDPPGIANALEANLRYLERLSPETPLPFHGAEIRAGNLRETSRALLDLVRSAGSHDAFLEASSGRFSVYRVTGDGQAPVLVTGYFQPELPASHVPCNGFSYPLYGVPSDLVRVDLDRFDSALPKKTLWGRVDGGCLVPYFTRQEIDGEGRLSGTPILAWLASPVDGLMLHIQGSGLLLFANGERRHIHVAATNGHPYGSIGAWLIRNGHLSKEEADWPGISAWARSNPGLFEEALAANPRYIFFEWMETGPIGRMGEVLTPYHSAALDSNYYPLGSVLVMRGDLPEGAPKGALLLCNQDSGAAITGPHRLDLYCGEGEKAGRTAGVIRNPAELYLVLLKKENPLLGH